MRRAYQIMSLLLATAMGFISGAVTARAGGSPDRAPTAILLAFVSLGITGFFVAMLAATAGSRRGIAALNALAGLVLALVSYQVAGWFYSPFHSVLGDAIVLAVSSVAASIGTAIGFGCGQGVAHWKSSKRMEGVAP
jgi:hypothetical protein